MALAMGLAPAAHATTQRSCVAHPVAGENEPVYVQWEYSGTNSRIWATFSANGNGGRVHFNQWDMWGKDGGPVSSLGMTVSNGINSGVYIGPWGWSPTNGYNHFARTSVTNAAGHVGWCDVSDGR